MTGDTTPQQQAVALLVEKFGCDKSVIALGEIDLRTLAACKHIGGGFLDFGPLTLGEIVDCLADAGLLCSSPVQPTDEDGSLRSVPSAGDGRFDIYVTVSREQVHRTSCHSDDTVNVDLDRNGVPVGVEIIGALEVTIDGRVVTGG